MDIAAAGALILFFSVFVAFILVGLIVFAYLAYSFLVVLSSTASGSDEVIWPGEPIPDWFFKGWYLGWLLAVWAVPATLIVSLLAAPRPLFALCVGACLWLLFPIGLLSSLSAESRMAVFRPMILRLLLKHPGATLCFYASSGLVVFVCGFLTYGALFGFGSRGFDVPLISIPLAAVFSAAGSLIYARLLGRTAFITGQSSSEEQPLPEAKPRAAEKPRPQRREPQSRELPKKKKLRSTKSNRAFDPWAIPPEEPPRKGKPAPSSTSLSEDPYGPAEGTYEVTAQNPTGPVSRHSPELPTPEQESVEAYAVSASVEGPPRKLPLPEPPQVSKLEEELAAPRLLTPLPDMPLVTGVYGFPFYAQTLGPWGTLAVGLFGVIGLLRLLLFMFPI